MRRLVIVFFGLAAAGGAHAQLYKWIDENGRVQYSQTPPPGKQAQEIRVPAAPSGSRPEPAGKAAGAAPSDAKAGQQPPAPGKKGTAKPGEKDEVPADARRMLGEWRTHPGARVQVKFQLQQGAGAAGLTTSQAWSVGSTSDAFAGMKVAIAGANGAGSVSQDSTQRLPSTLRYELKGDGLLLTVDSGPYAGTHLLTRQ